MWTFLKPQKVGMSEFCCCFGASQHAVNQELMYNGFFLLTQATIIFAWCSLLCLVSLPGKSTILDENYRLGHVTWAPKNTITKIQWELEQTTTAAKYW